MLFISALVFCGFIPCLAQQPTGPATLENLLKQTGTAPAEQSAPAEADKPAVQPARLAGRSQVTLVRPKDGVRHPDLDKAWAAYDAAVGTVAESVKAAIAKQLNAATAKGDLDSVERWQAISQKFEKAGELPEEIATKAAVGAAGTRYKKAKDELMTAYGAIVKALTVEKKLKEARAVRNEQDALIAAPGPLKWVAKPVLGRWIVDDARIINEQDKWPELVIEILDPPAPGQGFEFTCSVTLSNADWGQRMQVEMPGRKKAELGFGGKKEGTTPVDELQAGPLARPSCFLTPQKKYAFRCVVSDDRLTSWIDGKPYCVLPMIENQDPSAKHQLNPVVRLNFSWAVAEIQGFTVKALSGRARATAP